jgi:hypothetical protein
MRNGRQSLITSHDDQVLLGWSEPKTIKRAAASIAIGRGKGAGYWQEAALMSARFPTRRRY